MGPLCADRVKDTSTTTGTGQFTLANSAPTGFRTFGSVLSDGDTVYYTIAHQSASEWEAGVGTYVASGTKLTRTRVLASSNGGAAVNFSSGTKDVFVSPLASQHGWLPNIVPPDDSAFSWTNQGGAATAVGRSGVVLTAPNSSGNSLRVRRKATPSTPYTISALLLANPMIGTGYYGLCWRESGSGKLVTAIKGIMSNIPFGVWQWDDATNANAFTSYGTNPGEGFAPGLWLRLKDDGTTRYVQTSGDGQSWATVYSTSRTTFITPDQVGWFASANGGDMAVTLASWEEG